MNEISVVIPSYNSAATVGRTLEGLLSQRACAAKSIIVVDSSDDGRTPAVLSAFEGRGVRVVRLSEKTIPAVGRNLGAQQASGRYLAFIDSDAYPAPDWLEKISEAFAQGCRVGGGSLSLPDFQKRKMIALAQYFLQFNEFLDTGIPNIAHVDISLSIHGNAKGLIKLPIFTPEVTPFQQKLAITIEFLDSGVTIISDIYIG